MVKKEIITGNVKLQSKRIGEVNYNNFNSKMTIVEYFNSKNITIRFDNGFIGENRIYSSFKNGQSKSPYCRSIRGMGYVGEGKHKGQINQIKTKEYNTWQSVLERVYNKDIQRQFPTYIGSSLCEEWHNFQIFADWYDENFYEIEGHRMCLDKDILHRHNKIYSPENCVFVPNNINTLFIKCDSVRGNFPIGVTQDGKYNLHVHCSDNHSKQIKIGEFKIGQEKEAYKCYKTYKENLIKEVADEYEDRIPKIVYDAMYRYEVEITD